MKDLYRNANGTWLYHRSSYIMNDIFNTVQRALLMFELEEAESWQVGFRNF